MGSSVTGDGQGTALKVEGRKKCRVQVNTQQNRRQEKSGERAEMEVAGLPGHGPETPRTIGSCGTTVLATVIVMVAALHWRPSGKHK